MKQKKDQKTFGNHFCEYVKEFCETTTIHGFGHMVAPGRHWLEKVSWAIVVIGATALAVSIVHRTYARFDHDPIVISIDKNFRNFSAFYPATTVCLQDKLDEAKAENLIKRKWKAVNGSKSYLFYMDFLKILSNSSYDNLEDFKQFATDSTLNQENLGELMREINFPFDPHEIKINSVSKAIEFHETLTEMGICYSIFSKITPYLKPGRQINKTFNITREMPKLVTCHYYDVICLINVVGHTRSIKFYVHSPFDLPDSASKYYNAPNDLVMTVAFSFLSIKPDKPEKIRALKKKQRECLFFDESNFPESPYRSLRLCRMNCRRKLAMELCKCVPHFYVKRDNQPYCDLSGLTCLSNHSEYIIKLVTEDGIKYPCICYPSCIDTEYIFSKIERLVLSNKNGLSLPEANYGWKLEPFPKIAIKIDILFGIEDLMVYVGSTVALFLGCSIMSFVEIVYYFTLRMIRYFFEIYKKKKNDQEVTENGKNRFNYFAWENNNKRKIYVFREFQVHLYDYL